MPWDNHHLDIHVMKALHLSPVMILSWLCLCLLLFSERYKQDSVMYNALVSTMISQ